MAPDGGQTGANGCALAGTIARLPDRHAPQVTGNKGERACRDFGVPGARGQAQAGFPQVIERGLPELQRSRCARRQRDGVPPQCAAGDHERPGRHLRAVARRAGCAAGAAGRMPPPCWPAAALATLAGRRLLRQLDARALALNASPGGAADLLAATLFLDRLDLRVRRPSLTFESCYGNL